MDFAEALKALKMGDKVKRTNWCDYQDYIQIHSSDTAGSMTLPFIFMVTSKGGVVPWVPSQIDLLSTDWMIVF